MKTKAEITSDFIVRTVAPVFNKQGYSGTSMSDITQATGLTKGAVYGNFKDKNELAVKAFVYTVKTITGRIQEAIDMEVTAIGKLLAISNFYKDYFGLTQEFGGCPILNVGIDSNHQNPDLLLKVKKAIRNLQGSMATIVQMGIERHEIKPDVDPKEIARLIFTRVEGAVFMAGMFNEPIYMEDLGKELDRLILEEIKA